jgi:CBS domain-containing protein
VLVEDASGALRGVFTERDLMTRVDHRGHDWHGRTIGECMTAGPRCLDLDASLEDAIVLMQQGAFRNLPLVDASGRATGVLTVRDILRYIAENFPQEFVNLPPDPRHEATSRWGG